MKVLNLRCANGHGFEGWFGSDDDFMDQNGRGLIECPLCADTVVSRLPSAPRLNLSGARAPQQPGAAATTTAASSPSSTPSAQQQQGPPQQPPATADLPALWLKAVRHMMANTEDVGPRFAEEARRIHYGEVDARGIRGQATAAEREALSDEGIEVLSLPVPPALKGPLQ